MKPAPFRYYDPTTLTQALALLGDLENARVLAGGQSLGPMLNMRFASPDHLIDINGVAELAGIVERETSIEIGAMTRQRDVEFSPLIAAACPLLREAISFVGHRQTRNRGTVGGSLCHLDPSAEIPCVCAALEAQIEICGPAGPRRIPFSDFPAGYMTPAIEPNEMVTRIFLTKRAKRTGSAFVEYARRHGDFAIVSVAATIGLDASGAVASCAVALGGLDIVPLRMPALESQMIGRPPNRESIAQACEICRSVEPMEDPYASTAYRQHLATVLSRRALTRAAERALGAAA